MADNSGGSDGNSGGNGGNKLPPLKETLPGCESTDLLTRKCYNQLQVPEGSRLIICDRRHTYDSVLDTPELRQELVDRYRQAGRPGGFRIGPNFAKVPEERIFAWQKTQIPMNDTIYDAIRRY